jgi:hypothetical protein
MILKWTLREFLIGEHERKAPLKARHRRKHDTKMYLKGICTRRT